mgnify:CR=1 FL=1
MGKIKLSSAIDKDAVFHPSSVMSTAARDALVNFEVFPLILTLHYKYGLYVHSTHGSNAEHGDIRKGTGVANIVCGYYYIYLVDKNNLPLIRIRYAPSKRRSKTGSNDPAFHIERKRFFYSHDWADMEDSHLYSTDVKALIRKVSNHEITVKQITNILNFTMARTIREVLTDGFRLYMGEVKREVSNHDWSMTKDETTIVEGAGSKSDVQGRINQIRNEIDNTDSDYDREKLQERLAKLSGGVAVLKVGAATEVELKEKKHRIEDAVSTTKAAIEEGVVPGGGVALLRSQAAVIAAADALKGDEATGARMVAKSLEAPLKQIAENAGMEGGVVVEKVRNLKGSEGLNAATGDYVDLVKLGVIDAAKVTRSALQNAASIAALFLTTEAVIADKPEEAAPAMPGGGMDDY